MNPPPDTVAWNRAYDRLVHYLDTFALGDHLHASRLALQLLDESRELHQREPARDPVQLTLEHARGKLQDWLAENLREEAEPERVMTVGCVALLLSRLYRAAPESFLRTPLPDAVRGSLQRTLLTTGPGLNVSSMTPRHLDYGPMLGLARQTWHRWDAKTFFIALLFWAAVYVALYLWLSGRL